MNNNLCIYLQVYNKLKAWLCSLWIVMKTTFSIIFIPFIVFLQLLKLDGDNLKKEFCYQDVIYNTSVCRLICPSGTFYLPGMISCHPWLKCDADITIISLISVSVVKTVSCYRYIRTTFKWWKPTKINRWKSRINYLFSSLSINLMVIS